jgi:hypothetical protein
MMIKALQATPYPRLAPAHKNRRPDSLAKLPKVQTSSNRASNDF